MSGTDGHRKGNLSEETTAFLGRRRELTELRWTVVRCRLVTLTGSAGVGKTRLALRAADAVRAHYPDGVWLVELAALRTPELPAVAVAEALGAMGPAGCSAAEAVAEHLRDKRLLLVLDTCEHLVDACAHLVAELLTVAPGLTVLCTSRQPLRVRGERLLELRPLALPGDGGTPGAGVCEALEFFLRRAADAAPGIRFTAADAAAAVTVCRRLDGLPLALELAGARLRQMPVTELADRLSTRLDVLDVDGHTGARRHRTVRTAIGWSHELCAPLERLLWARLSVFADGFDLPMAREVCAGGPLTPDRLGPVLAGLVDKSVVVIDDGRHRMLDTVREYGGQWLAELGERDTVRRRHADAYRRLAEEVDGAWLGPRQREWHALLTAEHANLRAALDHHLQRGDAAAAVAMAGALRFFWCCGHHREGCHYLDRALALDRAAVHGPADGRPGRPAAAERGRDRDRLRAFWSRGYLALSQGDARAADGAIADCAARARAAGPDEPMAAAAHLLGCNWMLRGDPAAALAALAGVPPATPDGAGFTVWLAAQLTRGCALVVQGQFARAADRMDRVRTEYTCHGDLWSRSRAGLVRAQADAGRGELVSAALGAADALEGPETLRDTVSSAALLQVVASATLGLGGAERAARLLGFADSLWRQIDDRMPYSYPHLAGARRTCHAEARAALGDRVYERAYRDGSGLDAAAGFAYARATALRSGRIR